MLDGTFDAANGALVLQVDLEVSLIVLEVTLSMGKGVWLLIMSRVEVRSSDEDGFSDQVTFLPRQNRNCRRKGGRWLN